MTNPLHFVTRGEFRSWLTDHCLTGAGVWLLFKKTERNNTLQAGEALEEALCFGWIDGQMKRLDDQSYIKYFSPRIKNSKWSAKNKVLAEQLQAKGLMTDFGNAKIAEAKKNGRWDRADKPSDIDDKQIQHIAELLKENGQAYENFQNMATSVKKTYTRAYLDAKTEEGRRKRLAWMIGRIEKNLKPM